jgi:hypothetical protein
LTLSAIDHSPSSSLARLPVPFINKYSYRVQKIIMKRNLNSAHADGGPRSRVCARETLCSTPHRRERKFSGAPICRVTFKHLPQLLRTRIQRVRTLRQLLIFLNLKNTPSGPGGITQILSGVNIAFLCQYEHLLSLRILTNILLKFPKKNFKKH